MCVLGLGMVVAGNRKPRTPNLCHNTTFPAFIDMYYSTSCLRSTLPFLLILVYRASSHIYLVCRASGHMYLVYGASSYIYPAMSGIAKVSYIGV